MFKVGTAVRVKQDFTARGVGEGETIPKGTYGIVRRSAEHPLLEKGGYRIQLLGFVAELFIDGVTLEKCFEEVTK